MQYFLITLIQTQPSCKFLRERLITKIVENGNERHPWLMEKLSLMLLQRCRYYSFDFEQIKMFVGFFSFVLQSCFEADATLQPQTSLI